MCDDQAERDVRIEEEQAEMGESEKAAEERQLMAELQPRVLMLLRRLSMSILRCFRMCTDCKLS